MFAGDQPVFVDVVAAHFVGEGRRSEVLDRRV